MWRNLAVFVLFGATIVDTALFVNALHLGRENRDRLGETTALTAQNQERITDIQLARVTSCRLTYEGIRQVSKVFFRTKTVRTAKEQRNIDKFNNTVDNLKAGCDSQTGVQP